MYFLIEQQIKDGEKQIKTYGVGWDGENPILVQDISLSDGALRELVAQLNEQQLDPMHLLDVINDFLSS